MDGLGWLANATINLEIDDPATPVNPDYSSSTTSLPMPSNPSDTWFNLDFKGQYDLKPGNVVTVTDGTTTKQHTVTSVQITEANAITDVVSGTAAPNSYVDLQICFIGGCAYRTELADSNGNWAADFSVVGDQSWEIITFDIYLGTNGDVRQVDADIDTTMIHWVGTSKVFLPLMQR